MEIWNVLLKQKSLILIGKTLSTAVTVIDSWLPDGEGAATDQHGTLHVRV